MIVGFFVVLEICHVCDVCTYFMNQHPPTTTPLAAATLATAAALADSLRAALAPTTLEVLDETSAHAGHQGADPSGAGSHFRIRISSPLFTGLTRVRQHRLVYDALQEWIDRGVHAIAIEVL